jgi:BirA family transcriptional regulator, biotin operon repressor / biotin---[acetyl-CoA-carboxylase] ligase
MQMQVRCYASVTSTMDLAIAAAEAGAPEGLVVVAEHQTAGRGRRGRTWSSPPGAGLYLSCVLRPEAGENAWLSLITLAAGVAVRRGLENATGLTADLKWPNDLVVGRRKLAGILAEGVGIQTPAQAVVLGIGINLERAAHPPEIDSRATSVEEVLGHPVDPLPVRTHVLAAVGEIYARLRRDEADDILREWNAAAPAAHGASVEWDTPHGTSRGTTAGIDSDGALLVRTAHALERIVGGELRWL